MALVDDFTAVYQKGLLDKPIRYDYNIKPTTFLRDRLFGMPVGISTVKEALPYYYRDNTHMQLLSDNILGDKGSTIDPVKAHEVRFYRFSYFAKNANITRETGNTLTFSEHPGTEMSREQRNAEYARQCRDALSAYTDIFEEKLCDDILFNGSVTTTNGGENTFPHDSSLTAAVTTAWTNTASATPVADISTLGMKIFKKGGVLPNVILMNPADVEYLTKATTLTDFYNATQFEAGFIKYGETDIRNMVAVNGYINVPSLGMVRIMSYAGYYTDEAGTETAYIPKGKALLFRDDGSGIGCMNYGPCEWMDSTGPTQITGRRVFSVAATQKGAYGTYEVQMQSAPMPVPVNPNGWGVLTGISA